jgi:hypothetical protein
MQGTATQSRLVAIITAALHDVDCWFVVVPRSGGQ